MMQNQNVHPWPWGQGSAPPFQPSQTIIPPPFPSTGVDQNSLVSGYHQIYGNSSSQSNDFTQWNSSQLQQWQQWQQWQEKYQQWQIQYGKKYAESLVATGQNPSILLPGLNIPQNFLKSEKPNALEPPTPSPVPAPTSNPPLPPNSLPPPPPPDEEKPPPPVSDQESKTSTNCSSERIDCQEELSDAEKTFDIQFKQWEGQFNTWKKENQDHPDKAQYKEYEKKWEAWREQLLQRREQMRKKRLSQATERKIEQNNSVGNIEEKKIPPSGTTQLKPGTEYGYKTQPLPTQGLLSGDSKFENSQGPLSQSDNTFTSSRSTFPPNSFSSFSSISDHLPPNKTSYGNCKNLTKNQGPGVNYFSGYPKNHNQLSGHKLRNQNNNEGSRSCVRSESYVRKQRLRNENVFTSPYRFSCENLEKGKNDINTDMLGSSINIEKEAGINNLRKNEIDSVPSGNGPPSMRNQIPESNSLRNFSGSKLKVPSLFDITVEKPFGFKDSNFDRRYDTREKTDKNCYFDKKRKEREDERFQTNYGNNGFQFKTGSLPKLQTWEEGNSQRVQERNFGNFKNNSNWVKSSEQQKVEKCELSGYVGNILAKLGQCNALENERKFKTCGDQSFSQNVEKGKEVVSRTDFDYSSGESFSKDFCKTNESSVSALKETTENKTIIEGDKTKENSWKTEESEKSKISGDDDTSLFENLEIISAEKTAKDSERRIDDEDVNEDQLPSKPNSNKEDFTKLSNIRNDDLNSHKNFSFSNKNEKLTTFGRGGFNDLGKSSYRGQDDNRFTTNRVERRKASEKEEKNFSERKGGGRMGSTRDRDFVPGELVWKPQVFDYSQGRPLRITDPDEEFKISTVVDYSHGENMHTFEYRHGEGRGVRSDTKFFDYGHRTESPTVIDYGHGVENTFTASGFGKEEVRENGRNVEGKMKSGSEDSLLYRPRSRSPHLKYKRRSPSPSFRGDRGRGKDVIGRQLIMMRRNRKNSEDKSAGETDVSKPSFDVTTVLVEDLICRPGRETRPNKLVFIMRGIPGSGKTYVTKLIKDKEIESGGDAPRILSLDDYFMTEVEKEVKDKETGRKIKSKVLEYEYEAGMESHYRGSLIKAFKKTISDGFFSFVIVDSVNEKTKDYEEMWSFAKQKGFQVYVAEMDNDVVICTARNIHKRTEKEITDLAKVWEETPSHYLRLDVRSLLQSDAITEVEMEVVSDTELEKTVGKDEDSEILCQSTEKREKIQENKEEEEEEDEPGVSTFVRSRWDHFENSEQNLDRLDGLKRRREGFHETMEDYLQLQDDLDEIACDSAPGKKRVRWADLEERRQQEKMRAIGFVVGQTDWNRMTDPTFGESALTRTKYI